MSFGEVSVRGSLDRDIVRRIVRARLNEVRACYEQVLVEAPKLGGKLSLRFSVDAGGKVTKRSIKDSDIDSESLDDCILEALRDWKFPKPQDGGTLDVTVPFVFEPG